ncbi:uncharacterized protein N7511_004521 [Penicillium nucicola]|uniref:uncharacterized protein n=1 Tax=Penicillium nucicola TaxID=1850975 RepID=UPI0025457327|nr:uncharacterized protein N7511_004521 [Penicillium nucicola]KAJ5766905.1 hypothetical protein N7511_004521 [Penicillium nucicola]
MQYAPRYQMLYPSPLHPQQHPAQSAVQMRFCILRPEGLWTPLIPLDELPSWLQVCDWTPDKHLSLYPASLSFIPREGEYDVICSHCTSAVDSQHKSVSERGPSSASSRAARVQNFPVQCYSPPKMQSEPRAITTEFDVTYGILGQPPFCPMLQSPIVGMCLVDAHAQKEELAVASDAHSPETGTENSMPPGSFDQISARTEPCSAHDAELLSISNSSLSIGSSGNIPSRPKPDILKRHSRHTHAHDDGLVGTPRRVLSLRDDSSASAHSAAAMAAILAKQIQRTRSRRISRTSSLQQSAISLHQSAVSLHRSASSLRRKIVAGADTAAPWSYPVDAHTPKRRISKVPSIRVKVKSKGRRKVRMRREEAGDQVAPISPTPARIEEIPQSKAEQPNAATKRRDRRERLMRKRNHTDRGSRYWHMMKIPNWRAGIVRH